MTDRRFFDTSALVKRYAEEPGTETVDRLIESPDATVYVTSIAVVEMTSAFRRKHSRGECTEETMLDLLSAFYEDALQEYVVLPVDETLFEWSVDLILEDDLRTLDSLQLAAALALAAEVENVQFVCADRRLVETARSRGLNGVDPSELPACAVGLHRYRVPPSLPSPVV